MQSKDLSFAKLQSSNAGFTGNSSIIIYRCNLDKAYPIIEITENAEEILGYQAAAFYKNSSLWIERIHPENRPNIKKRYLKTIEHKNQPLVYRFKHAAGHYVWLRDERMVDYDKDGNKTAIIGIAIDISRQKRAELELKELNKNMDKRIDERTRNLKAANRKLKKQLQMGGDVEKQISEQQKRLRLLQAGINSINDMVVISKAPLEDSLNSSILLVNKAFTDFTGYSSAEVMGKCPSFLIGEKTDPARVMELNDNLRKNERSRIEFINYKKDGSTYWVDLEMSPFPADGEDMLYWVGINRDITQRKKAERALEESEEKYRTYTELSFDAILEITPNGIISSCNERTAQLFGYSSEELLNMHIRKLAPDAYKDYIPEIMGAEIATGSKLVQRTYKKKDGSVLSCEINTKLYQRNGEDHIIAYVRDISEKVRYQDALKKSLLEKDTLLAEVHHRVKNNLAVISGLLEMQSFNVDSEEIANALQESQSRIQSIATVHEILYQSDSFSNIMLDTYIDELTPYIELTFNQGGTNILLKKDLDSVSLTVKQAVPCGLLLNELITNAYKHAFKRRDKGTIFISMHREKDTIKLEIQDDGIGLPADLNVEKPSSLGMKLIKTLVRQLDGSLAIEKKPATAFKIEFKIED